MRLHKVLLCCLLYVCFAVEAAKLGKNFRIVQNVMDGRKDKSEYNRLNHDYRNAHQVETIIIGAGVSGLAAASRLTEKGNTDFMVLEAESRLGGRVYTTSFGGVDVEVGAQWIHGIDGNMVHYIASKLGKVLPGEHYWAQLFYYSNGSRIPYHVLDPAIEYFDEIYDERTNEMKAFEGSVEEFLRMEFQEHIDSNPDTDPSLLWSILEWELKEACTDDASETLKIVKTKSYNNYQYCDGDDYTRWTAPFSTLIDYLVKDVPDENIRTNCEVTSIDWSYGVTATCKNGERYHGKRVLITVSLGVLKTLPTNFFTPPLPKEKKDAIKSLHFSTVNKIYVKFPHRWWPEDINELGFTWSENEDSYTPEIYALKDSWVRDLYTFIDGYGDNSTLIGWIFGNAAVEMESLSEDQVKEDTMKLLQAFMTGYDIPEPTDFFRTTWFSNPFTRGSYSSISEVTDEMYLWQFDLARPVKDICGNEVLLFAGEATHDWYFSTTHGALETGWREGDRILRNIEKGTYTC